MENETDQKVENEMATGNHISGLIYAKNSMVDPLDEQNLAQRSACMGTA